MLCMMALESLCKENQGESGSAAASRAAKLIAATKRDQKEIHKLIWNPDSGLGFFQLRNGIAHGDKFDIDVNSLIALRNVVRYVLKSLAEYVFPRMDRSSNYYRQLNQYAEERFKQLKNG